jgi:hypothetical protein
MSSSLSIGFEPILWICLDFLGQSKGFKRPMGLAPPVLGEFVFFSGQTDEQNLDFHTA